MKRLAKYWIVFAIVFVVFIFIQPAVCFLIVGLIVFYLCLNTILLFNHLRKRGITVTANMVSFEEDTDNDKIPVIAFKTLQGELINGKPAMYSVRENKTLTMEVQIIYQPQRPQKFILSDEKIPYFGLAIGLLLSTSCVMISAADIVGYIKY